MFLSDISVKRPIFAAVINLLLIAFGIVSFFRLPLREYPDIDPPIVTIDTSYKGAAASVVESRITEVIEDRIAGLEGIKTIASQSQDGRSTVTVEFDIKRDIDDAANDIRDRVSRIVDEIPEEADPPEIRKADSNDDVILWFTLSGEGMSIMELTDYAHRYLEDQFSSIDGVARVRIGGGQDMALRIWLNRDALAARNLTVSDVENALRSENLELPAGSIESKTMDFTVRMKRSYKTEQDFRNLILVRGQDNYLVRLGEVAKVEIGPVEERALLRGDGIATVGIGIIKQSKANTLDVAKQAKAQKNKVAETLPKNMKIGQSSDTSIFVASSIHEVYKTLFIAVGLVVLVIYAFLGNVRATLVPAVTVPVSLIGTFIVLYMLGFTINLLTLLALVLAIGLVVDDAIVVIENIHRRIELGEPRLVAAFRGTQQVGFAVVATTVVLISVFFPITFMEGNTGRLFTEFAVTMAASVGFSGLVALTFSPMLSSKILDSKGHHNALTFWLDKHFEQLKASYLHSLKKALERPYVAIAILVLMLGASLLLLTRIPGEFTPKEDRGFMNISIRGPEGASYEYTLQHVNEIEKRLQPFITSGEFERILVRVPGSFGALSSFNDANVTIMLKHWDSGRKPIWYYINKVREVTADIPGVQISPIARQAFGSGANKPIQFVLGGSTYQELVEWRDILIKEALKNPKILNLESDFLETKPQLGITIDRDRAGDLGVSVSAVNNTLETMLGSRRVTTFVDRGEEYDVVLESQKDLKRSPLDISNLYVRSDRSGQLIPLSNVVNINEFADASTLRRYNRLRSITISGSLADGYTLGEALNYLENLVKTELPGGVHIDYKGESLQYKDAGHSVYLIFGLALLVVFLVLAGQFESFVHPFIIMLTVPLAITGALVALWLTGKTLNIYSEIGLIMLIGIAAKNGILIVEFVNQLRDEGMEFKEAILDASGKRLRPIIMTCITTAMGAVPLILSTGAGSENRVIIGIVVFTGVILAMSMTIYIVPMMYALLAKNTLSPQTTSRHLETQLKKHKHVN